MTNSIFIMLDHEEGTISAHSYELAAAARSIAEGEGLSIMALGAWNDVPPESGKFARETGVDLIVLVNPGLRHYSAEAYINACAPFFIERRPLLVLGAHNARGCDFAPALALRTGLACATGAEEIFAEKDAFRAVRTIWHGKVREELTVVKPALVTLMPGAYSYEKNGNIRPGSVTAMAIDLPPGKTSPMPPISTRTGEGAGLSEAEVVVAAGRGVGGTDNMALLRGLAGLFPRSAIGGTRGACDMGLVSYGAQVGMTGRTVSPRLYIACGISGSAQHIAGMKNSRHIVPVNHDPDAPIFRIADIGIVDKIERFLPIFNEKVSGQGKTSDEPQK